MKKNAQVWIETVLYTIIGLAIIGVVLGFVIPKVNQSKDNVVIEQSIASLKEFDSKVKDVASQSGNIGRVDFTIKRGYLFINSTNNRLIFVIDDLTLLYSEPGVVVSDGNVQILTLEGQKNNLISLTIDYPYNITFNGEDEDKKLTAAPFAYKISIENKGNGKIDIRNN